MFDLVYRFAPANPVARKLPANAEEELALLARQSAEMTDPGRTQMATRVNHFDPRAFGWGVAATNGPVQAPFAAALACADARVPTEMMFGKGCDELFVVRVAGNVLGSECLGSLRYAVGTSRTLSN